MAKPRVLILHNIVAPYRLPLFEALQQDFDVTVPFCKQSTKDRKWQADRSGYTFTSKVMPSVMLGPVVVNPFIGLDLLESYDAYLVADNEENVLSTILFVLCAKLRGRPVLIWNEHTEQLGPRSAPNPTATYRFLKGIEHRYRAWLYKAGKAFLSMSGKLTDEYLTNRGVPKTHIFTNTQVMPAELLAKPAAKPEYDFPYLLYLGYFRPEKGLRAFLAAFQQAETKGMKLVIAGAGPEEDDLRAMAQGNDSVIFAGYADDKRKATLYAGAAAMVLPSFYEPWGLVVNESLFYGTPVLCSDAVAASAVITPGKNGLTFIAGDVDSMVACVSEFCTDPALQKRLKKTTQKADKKPLTDPIAGTRHFKAAIIDVLGTPK